jgi:predicted PP-loop superfamily ATPase
MEEELLLLHQPQLLALHRKEVEEILGAVVLLEVKMAAAVVKAVEKAPVVLEVAVVRAVRAAVAKALEALEEKVAPEDGVVPVEKDAEEY